MFTHLQLALHPGYSATSSKRNNLSHIQVILFCCVSKIKLFSLLFLRVIGNYEQEEGAIIPISSIISNAENSGPSGLGFRR